MADSEPTNEVTTSSVEPIRWPDPSRPIVNQRPPNPGGGVSNVGRDMNVGSDFNVGRQVPSRVRRLRRPFIPFSLLLLVVILVTVWLLWWR